MTSRSRRKPRTTAPRTWGPGTACRLALVAALAGGTASAQQPTGLRPAAVYGSPYPTTVGQPGGAPGGGFARPGMPFQQPVQPQPQQQPSAPPPTGTTGRPDAGPPPGYRPVGGSTAQPLPRSERVGAAGGAGQVMYFHKPADALAADGVPEAGAVAQVSAPPLVPAPPTDAPVGVPALAPPPLPFAVPDRPIAVTPPLLTVPAPVFQEQPAPQPVPQPAPQPVPQPAPAAQPTPADPMPMPKVGTGPFLAAEVTSVPSRDKIFGMMYDDAALQKAIIERAKEDARRRSLTDNKDKKDVPPADGKWEFPALTPIVPAGTPFVTRTGSFPPARAVFEPGFVVHRRLHFEEKNSERYGWDLGFASPFVSAAAFYKDVLLWPNSLGTSLARGAWDTNAGKCLPGSPVPYNLYPPGLTITGGAAEGLVVTGLAFIIP